MFFRNWKSPRARWRSWTSAKRDTVVAIISAVIVWVGIERTETCDRFFEWVAENPDYEADSVILAFLLISFGITFCAWRRYREMVTANHARDLAERHVHTLAYHDPVTGLLNRRALNEKLVTLTSRDAAHPCGLIFVDLDRFKSVNDVHGHVAGDRLLRLVAERLACCVGERGALFRLGGDEFAISVELAGEDDPIVRNIARQVVQHSALPFEDEGLVHHIGASAGIAQFPGDADDADALVRAADVALYRAKQSGRNQFRSYESAMDDQIRQRAVLEQELRLAIPAGEFRPYYQPLVDLASGQTAGFELLARWERADGIYIGPDEFIPIAEECGLMNELMLGLVEKTCVEARGWDPSLSIAINISPVQLKDPWLSQKLIAVLARHGFPPQRFSIEITENAIISDEENATRTIESLKNQGMRIGLDDFGTGYASLHHLRLLPFDKIKIDKSFILNMGVDEGSLKIVKAIMGLAFTLDLPVVAEGIESAETAALLRSMGCAQGQGFHFGHPVPAETINESLRVCARAEVPPLRLVAGLAI